MIVKYRHGYAWGYSRWEYMSFPDSFDDDTIEEELMGDNVPYLHKYRRVHFHKLSDDQAAQELDQYSLDNRTLERHLKHCRGSLEIAEREQATSQD